MDRKECFKYGMMSLVFGGPIVYYIFFYVMVMHHDLVPSIVYACPCMYMYARFIVSEKVYATCTCWNTENDTKSRGQMCTSRAYSSVNFEWNSVEKSPFDAKNQGTFVKWSLRIE